MKLKFSCLKKDIYEKIKHLINGINDGLTINDFIFNAKLLQIAMTIFGYSDLDLDMAIKYKKDCISRNFKVSRQVVPIVTNEILVELYIIKKESYISFGNLNLLVLYMLSSSTRL